MAAGWAGVAYGVFLTLTALRSEPGEPLTGVFVGQPPFKALMAVLLALAAVAHPVVRERRWLMLALVFSAVTSSLRLLNAWDEMLLTTVFSRVAWLLAIELLVLVPALVWVGLWITHKVVGPFSRIKFVLEQIGRGNYTVRLHLRKGDVLTELADAINQLADSMQGKRSS